MARNLRQSKILELISVKEIETQEDLVNNLKASGYNVTQATISRDIKELGLTKVLTDNNKYKYASISSNSQAITNKNLNIFKECIVSIKTASNLVVVKTLKGTANMVSGLIDQMSIVNILGCTYGDDTVLVITSDVEDSYIVKQKINEMIL